MPALACRNEGSGLQLARQEFAKAVTGRYNLLAFQHPTQLRIQALSGMPTTYHFGHNVHHGHPQEVLSSTPSSRSDKEIRKRVIVDGPAVQMSQ